MRRAAVWGGLLLFALVGFSAYDVNFGGGAQTREDAYAIGTACRDELLSTSEFTDVADSEALRPRQGSTLISGDTAVLEGTVTTPAAGGGTQMRAGPVPGAAAQSAPYKIVYSWRCQAAQNTGSGQWQVESLTVTPYETPAARTSASR